MYVYCESYLQIMKSSGALFGHQQNHKGIDENNRIKLEISVKKKDTSKAIREVNVLIVI